MGTTTEILKLLFDADMAAGVQKVEGAGTAVEKSAKKSQSSLDKLGGGLTKAGAGMIGFGAASLFGLGKMAQASEEAHLSEVKLQNTLRNMPKLAGENKQQFLDLATAIQKKTAADADSIVEGEAMLGTFNLTAKQIKGITPLVVDYARKFGTDIPAAATQVGKALDGSIGALKKNGVSIDEALYKTDRYAAVQKALNDQVGGFAEDEGKTFAGSLERLQNQLGDLAEGVGAGVVDAFTEMAGVTGSVVDKLNSLDPGVTAGVGKWATYGAAALTAAGGLSFLAGQAITARQRFSTLAGAVKDNSDVLATLGRGAANAALNLGILIEASHLVDDLFKEAPADANKLENSLLRLGRSHQVSGELADKYGDHLGDLKKAVEQVISPNLADKAEHVTGELSHLGGLLGDTNLDGFRSQVDEVDKALARLAARSPKAAAASLNELIDRLGLSDAEAKKFRASLDDYQSTLAEVDTSKATSGVKDLGGAMDEGKDATKEAEDALKDYTDTLRGMYDPLFAQQDAALDAAKAQQTLSEKTLKQAEAEDKWAKAVRRHGEDSKAAREAQAELAEANRDLAEATLGAEKSTLDFSTATRELQDKLKSGSIDIDLAKKQLYNMAIAAGFSKGEALKMAASLDTVASSAKKVPRNATTVVEARNAAKAQKQLDAVRAAVDRIPKSKHIQIDLAVAQKGGINIGGGIKVFASGGELGPGEIGIVGDAGPEVAVGKPGGGAHIYNQQQLRSIGGGGAGGSIGRGFGGGDTYIVNVYPQGHVLTARDLIAEINGALDRGHELRQRGRTL